MHVESMRDVLHVESTRDVLHVESTRDVLHVESMRDDLHVESTRDDLHVEFMRDGLHVDLCMTTSKDGEIQRQGLSYKKAAYKDRNSDWGTETTVSTEGQYW